MDFLEMLIMDDPAKGVAKTTYGVEDDSATNDHPNQSENNSTFVAYMDEPADPQVAAKTRNQTTSAKALDRWFAERQKNLGSPRLLDIPNEALISRGGPINLTGNITLVQEDGSITYANHLSLCRCGASAEKPVCDEQHFEAEFLHSGRMHEASDAQHIERPSKITISIIKDGPITFKGRMRMHNNLGQECVKVRGALCRCGQSANKPFCDGSHEKVGFRSAR